MSAFRFDPVRHEYWLDDERLPNVSEIIEPLVDYSMVPEDRLKFACDRGTAVHRACHLDDVGDLDESTCDPVHVMPYLAAWRKFKSDFKPEIEFSEVPMYHKRRRYAGTPDRGIRVKRIRGTVDIKTVAVMSPVTGVQLSGYEDLILDFMGWQSTFRWVVQLRPDGTYKRVIYPDERITFLSLFNIKTWELRHG